MKHVVNLGAYVGQTVDLQIRTETDKSLISDLLLDDISLQPTAAAAAAVTRAESAAWLTDEVNKDRPAAERRARRFTGARVPASPPSGK